MPDTQWRNSTSRTAACLVLGASEKWKRSPFWGDAVWAWPRDPGWPDVSASHHPTSAPAPKHGATARSDHGRHKASGPRQRAAFPQSFCSLDPSLWNISSKSLGPLITMATTSHENQPELFPERQGVTSAASPWENPSGAPVIISWQGWGAWQQVTQHLK